MGTKCLNKVLHHPKWPKCKFLHLHQNRSKLIKTGRNRSKQIVNDDMIYKKIKKEKKKMYFPYNKRIYLPQFISSPFCFFPSKKILPYLCYVFPPSKNNISPFFSMPHFFCSTSCNIFFPPLIFTVLKFRFGNSELRFFSRVDGFVQKRKKGKGKK